MGSKARDTADNSIFGTHVPEIPLAWAAVPLLVYLVVLFRLWANAPVWDDYGTVLDTLTRMGASQSAAEWLELLVHQHNEHRIFTVRLVERARGGAARPARLPPPRLPRQRGVHRRVPPRVAEFRESLVGPVVAAAAFVMFQWSYYEAGLWSSGGLTNMGAIFFAFAGARRGAAARPPRGRGVRHARHARHRLLGERAPRAADRGCGRRAATAHGARRSLRGVAAFLWILYFQGYVKPLHHPSPTVALLVPGTR
jgi:hypothetical protein